MAKAKEDEIRARVNSELIDKEDGLTAKELCRIISQETNFDRSSAYKALTGRRTISRGFLDAIEQIYGFSRRHYIETGEWPNIDQNLQQLSRLPEEQLTTLIRTAKSPNIHWIASALAKHDSETISLLKTLLTKDPKVVKLLLMLVSNEKAQPFAHLVLGNAEPEQKIREFLEAHK